MIYPIRRPLSSILLLNHHQPAIDFVRFFRSVRVLQAPTCPYRLPRRIKRKSIRSLVQSFCNISALPSQMPPVRPVRVAATVRAPSGGGGQ
jgi:hypothetical protein